MKRAGDGVGAPRRLRTLLKTAGVTIEPLLADDAEPAGALRSIDGG